MHSSSVVKPWCAGYTRFTNWLLVLPRRPVTLFVIRGYRCLPPSVPRLPFLYCVRPRLTSPDHPRPGRSLTSASRSQLTVANKLLLRSCCFTS